MLYDPKWKYRSPIARNLIAAREAIREHGWSHRGGLIDVDGRLCFHGAVCCAVDNWTFPMSDANVKACRAMADYLRSQGSPDVVGDYGCAYWNNNPERTEQQMLDGIEAAADWVEARERVCA